MAVGTAASRYKTGLRLKRTGPLPRVCVDATTY